MQCLEWNTASVIAFHKEGAQLFCMNIIYEHNYNKLRAYLIICHSNGKYCL